MREIKFRGKVKTKKIVEMNGYTLVPDTWLTTDLIAGGDHQGVMVEKIHEFWHLVDDGWIDENTVGQWAGLKDSKGVEIYEGDIIQSVSIPEIKATVEFTDGQFTGFVAFNFHDLSIARGWSSSVTVIGNIHDKGKDELPESK